MAFNEIYSFDFIKNLFDIAIDTVQVEKDIFNLKEYYYILGHGNVFFSNFVTTIYN